MENNPIASVIVATLNRDKVLCDTLESLKAQSYSSFEIIVVDQSESHTDETQKYFERNRDHVRLTRIDEPGLPNARNVGLEQARGQVALFCDDDVQLVPDWIRYHVENYAIPAVGGVGGRVVEPDLPVIPDKLNHAYINAFGRPKGNFTSVHRSTIKTVWGCNMSFGARVLREIGGFDTNFIGRAMLEETDVCYRILEAGYEIVFDPRAELVHLPQPSGNLNSRRSRHLEWYRTYLHNGTLFALKNKPGYELPLILATQMLIALKQGWLRGGSVDSAGHILGGIVAGWSTYRSGEESGRY